MQEGLIDMLVAGGGYAPFEQPTRRYAELAHRYDVPFYAAINCSVLIPEGKDDSLTILRAVCCHFLAEGADGIYIFNFHTPMDGGVQSWANAAPLLSQIGEAATMQGHDKVFVVAPATESWMAFATAPYQLPVKLAIGKSRSIVFPLAEDLNTPMADGSLRQVRLRMDLENVTWLDQITYTLNDRNLDPIEAQVSLDPNSSRHIMTWKVDPARFDRHRNELTLGLKKKNQAVAAISVMQVRVEVEYAH